MVSSVGSYPTGRRFESCSRYKDQKMVTEVQNWILFGVTGLLLTIVWFSLRRWVVRIDKKFDELIRAVNDLIISNEKQNVEILNITKRVDCHDKRLNDHSKRIRNIEINIIKK